VDREAGHHLKTLMDLKPGSHYGNALLGTKDRKAALRAAVALVDAAAGRS
jgi:hypothetical protein